VSGTSEETALPDQQHATLRLLLGTSPVTTIEAEYDAQNQQTLYVKHHGKRVGCLFWSTVSEREWSMFFCNGLWPVSVQLEVLQAVTNLLNATPIPIREPRRLQCL
jgi:hypothetical protein